MSSGLLLVLMGGLFLLLGYMGVPVAFAIIAGVLAATAFTPISFQSMVGQLFHGIDSETLLAVPFFLLVGELMSSADVTHRMIRLAQTLVGHLRGGLAQVVTLFSMFFAGISGSSAADVAVLSRTVAPEMDKERYDRAFTAALMAAAAYILLVLIPVLNPRHVRRLPGDFMYTGLLYSLPLAAVAGASAFGWMLAYLRGPDTVAEYISYYAGTDPRMIMLLLVALFVILGDFIDAIPAIIIFMPIINKLTQVGRINPVHMGVVIITPLVFGLITPPYGLSLLIASKFVGVPFYRAMLRSFPLYIVFFATIAFTVLFPDVVLWLPKQLLPQSVGCFPNPNGTGWICPR